MDEQTTPNHTGPLETRPLKTGPAAVGASAAAEELPPVTPPSAGFIVQLFLIPALIVAAVVAVWALFGKLADSEADWQHLVTELGSSNENLRWRAAMGLAGLLQNDQISPVEGQIPLNEQPIVVQGLTELLRTSLSSNRSDDEEIRHQEFLCRTLGSLNADDSVLPVLVLAMSAVHPSSRPEDDPKVVIKSALMSVALIAGRRFEQATGYSSPDARPGIAVPTSEVSTSAVSTSAVSTSAVPAPDGTPKGQPALSSPLSRPVFNDPALWTALKTAAQDSDPVVRHLAAFAIASVSGPESIELLRGMLFDGDRNARANAAIGLARNGYPDALPVIAELLEEAAAPFDSSSLSSLTPEEQRMALSRREVEQPIIVRNCLRAISELWPVVDSETRTRLRLTVGRLEDEYFAPDVRMLAGTFLRGVAAE